MGNGCMGKALLVDLSAGEIREEAVPDQVYRTLEVISPCLPENAVVMDTSPLKSVVAKWAKELLPPKRHFVGIFPSVNPDYDPENSKGIDGARSDLFHKSIMAITANKGTEGAAIKLAADLSSLLGANPFFVDLIEADVMSTYIHIMPQIVLSAFTNLSSLPRYPAK